MSSTIVSGTMPALADGFTARPESAPSITSVAPGSAVALVCAAPSQPGRSAGSGAMSCGSCGKTQLAVHAAQSLWRSGRLDLLAWVDASSRASTLSGYTEAAAAVGIESAGPAEQVATRLKGWLADTARPWLLVLDGLRDGGDLDGLWPCGPAGTVLITAPDQQAVTGEDGKLQADVVPVGRLTTREALSYLMDRLADDTDQRHGAIDLTISLGSDPLALAQASAVIATTTQSCADYQRQYRALVTRLASQVHDEPSVPHAVTWMLSAERASQLVPGGATQILLAIAALLDGHAVPASLFTTSAVSKYLTEAGAPAEADRAWDAVRALAHTGLLTLDLAAAAPVVRVSRLVATLVRATVARNVLDRLAVVAADGLLEIWPERELQRWLASGIRSCADALQRIAGERLWTGEACHPLLLKNGHSLDAATLTGPAVRHWSQLAATSQRILGSESSQTLVIGSHLADALLPAGQASEASAWWHWVVTGRIRAIGPDHPDTLAARVSLGRALVAAGQPGNAVIVLEQAATDHQRVRGPGHPDTLTAQTALAAACQADGLGAEAIGHYRRILAEHERLHGARHPATMAACDQLAAACLADGRLKDAISCYKKALADRQHALGTGHPDTIATRRDLAAAYEAAGKIAAALQLREQVSANYERGLGADHPDTLASRAELAKSYVAAGRLADGSTMLRYTLTRCEQALPPGASLTATVRLALTELAAP